MSYTGLALYHLPWFCLAHRTKSILQNHDWLPYIFLLPSTTLNTLNTLKYLNNPPRATHRSLSLSTSSPKLNDKTRRNTAKQLYLSNSLHYLILQPVNDPTLQRFHGPFLGANPTLLRGKPRLG